MTATGRAAAMVVGVMFAFVLIDSMFRFFTPHVGLWQFHVLRGIVIGLAMLALARVMGWSLRPRNWRRVWARSIIASLAMVFYFGALSLMSLGQAGAGLFSAPIFVLLISALGFGVRIGPVRIVAVAIGFIGVLLILRPWGAGLSPAEALIALAGGLFYAFGAVVTRHWCAEEGTAAMTNAYFLAMGGWGLLGLGVVTLLDPVAPAGPEGFFLRGWVTPPPDVLGWIVLHALGSIAAIGVLIRAYQMAEASRITVFEYSFLPAAALVTWALFGEAPDLLAVAGMACIVLAGVVIALRPATTAPPPAQPAGESPTPG